MPALWQLTPERVGEWRGIRLAALKDAPGIFADAWADWVDRPDADFLPPLDDSDCWAAGHVPGHPLAVARWGWHDTVADAAMLMSVFARPEARGTGMIDALIDHLLGRAGGQARCMLLHVARGNDPAVRLYRRHGFQPTARAPFPNRAGVIEIEMMRPLPA